MKRTIFITVATCALLLGPLPASAADLDALARDLERALGRGSVEVRRDGRTTARSAARRTITTDRVTTTALVDAMNRQRAAYGLGPLRPNGKLSLAANDRVADMFDQHYFDHVSPQGTSPFVWVTRRGYPYRSVGENLAVGYTTADRIVTGWMNSPPHRQNILGRAFNEIGIAVAPGAPLRGYGGPTVVAIYASR